MPRRRPTPPAGPRLVKRYENRKLYDAAAGRHVTIEDIARLIAAGEDVVVEDRRTGEDITSVVLAQVILDRVKERGSSIPRQVLTRLIRLGAGPAAAWAEWDGPQEAAARARAEAERIAAGLAASMQHLVAEAQGTVQARLREWLPTEAARPRARPARTGGSARRREKTGKRRRTR